jgi:hypothetical protein
MPRRRLRYLDSLEHLDSCLDTSTAAFTHSTAEALGGRGLKEIEFERQFKLRALEMSSAPYTALRAELTTLNTADTTSSSSTGKGTMDIDGRAGATGVVVAGETLANSDICSTLMPRQQASGGIRKASTSDSTNPTMPADKGRRP